MPRCRLASDGSRLSPRPARRTHARPTRGSPHRSCGRVTATSFYSCASGGVLRAGQRAGDVQLGKLITTAPETDLQLLSPKVDPF